MKLKSEPEMTKGITKSLQQMPTILKDLDVKCLMTERTCTHN